MGSETHRDSGLVQRIFEFFAAADLINKSHLMFSRDTFSDKNGGVDILLRQLEFAHTHACINMGWSDQELARKKHVETVAVDPRCPKHKAQFMKNRFESKDI